MWINWRGVLTEGIASTKKQLEEARDMGEIHIPEEFLSDLVESAEVRKGNARNEGGHEDDESSDSEEDDRTRAFQDVDELSSELLGKWKEEMEEGDDLEEDANERPEQR